MSAVNQILPSLGWLGIIRLGLVQTAIGAIVVLTTSTINRVMVVELALPAMLPGALVAIHYALQIFRPWLGHGSDSGGRRTPWIIGGMALLAAGGVGAAVATALMAVTPVLGTAVALLAFCAIGMGVGAAGTSLLVLLAKRVEEARRPAAATVVWVMMITGFILTAAVTGHFLDPFSLHRLVMIAAAVAIVAMAITVLAVWGIEGAAGAPTASAPAQRPGLRRDYAVFKTALSEVWGETTARRFTIFVFISMFAYSMQDLILEPFAGLVFQLTPGQSTQLSGIQNSGVLSGMIIVGVAGTLLGRRGRYSPRVWMMAGCLASAVALAGLALAAQGALGGDVALLRLNVFLLGLTNGVFAVAAIGSMMTLVGKGKASREGVRMGLWGAAQAIAFGLGGFAGTAATDALRWISGDLARAYGSVFALEAMIFIAAAGVAARIVVSPAEAPSVRGHRDEPVLETRLA